MRTGMKKKEGDDKEAAGLLSPYQTYRQGKPYCQYQTEYPGVQNAT